MLTVQQAGQRGGRAAAAKMNEAQRKARARKAAEARWGNSEQRRARLRRRLLAAAKALKP